MESMMVIALVVLGFLAHLFGDLAEESTKNGGAVDFTDFISKRRYSTIFSLLGAAIGYIIFSNDIDKMLKADAISMAYISALGIGYTSDSLVRKFATIASNKMEKRINAD